MVQSSSNYELMGDIWRSPKGSCDISRFRLQVEAYTENIQYLMDRDVSDEEFDSSRRGLRSQYLSKRVVGHDGDDDRLYDTGFQFPSGVPICLNVVLTPRRSCFGAHSKMLKFTLCNKAGDPIWLESELPWEISNLKELAYGLRRILRHHFSPDLLGDGLFKKWRAAGASTALPQCFPICEGLDGSVISVGFDDGSGAETGRRKAESSLYRDDDRVDLNSIQPLVYQRVQHDLFCREKMDEFNKLRRTVGSFFYYDDWKCRIVSRYNFAASGYSKSFADAVSPDGNAAEVFNTGEADGRDYIYALFFNRASDGRWSELRWIGEADLPKYGVSEIPAPPDFECVRQQHPPLFCGFRFRDHLIAHPERWADPESLGSRDGLGRLTFVNDAARDAAFASVKDEICASLKEVERHPELIAYGYYDSSAADGVRGTVSPVVLFLPVTLSSRARASGIPNAAVAIRVVRREGHALSQYEAITILTLEMARRCVRVTDFEMPSWLGEA